jgi:hypothetical protein
MADRLLRHEKQFFSRLLTDLIDTVKQRSGENKLDLLNTKKNIILQTIFLSTSHRPDRQSQATVR